MFKPPISTYIVYTYLFKFISYNFNISKYVNTYKLYNIGNIIYCICSFMK